MRRWRRLDARVERGRLSTGVYIDPGAPRLVCRGPVQTCVDAFASFNTHFGDARGGEAGAGVVRAAAAQRVRDLGCVLRSEPAALSIEHGTHGS